MTTDTKRPSHTTAPASALALAVIFTPPPVWALRRHAGPAPYWQVEVRDETGTAYSPVYRVKDEAKANALAEDMARDRGIPIRERTFRDSPAPWPPAAPPPEPAWTDTARDGEALPF